MDRTTEGQVSEVEEMQSVRMQEAVHLNAGRNAIWCTLSDLPINVRLQMGRFMCVSNVWSYRN